VNFFARLLSYFRGEHERTADKVDGGTLDRWRAIEDAARLLSEYDALLERRARAEEDARG